MLTSQLCAPVDWEARGPQRTPKTRCQCHESGPARSSPLGSMKQSNSSDGMNGNPIHTRCLTIVRQAQAARAGGGEDEFSHYRLAVLREDFERRSVHEQAQSEAAVGDAERGFVAGGELGMEIRFARARPVHD